MTQTSLLVMKHWKTYIYNKKPIHHGLVEDWNSMESLIEQVIFKYLRAGPEDYCFLLTGPPLNTPESREYTPEIVFESFNVQVCTLLCRLFLRSYILDHKTNRRIDVDK